MTPTPHTTPTNTTTTTHKTHISPLNSTKTTQLRLPTSLPTHDAEGTHTRLSTSPFLCSDRHQLFVSKNIGHYTGAQHDKKVLVYLFIPRRYPLFFSRFIPVLFQPGSCHDLSRAVARGSPRERGREHASVASVLGTVYGTFLGGVYDTDGRNQEWFRRGNL